MNGRREAYGRAVRAALDAERQLAVVDGETERSAQMVKQRIERVRPLSVTKFNGVAAKDLRDAHRRLRSTRKLSLDRDNVGDQEVFQRPKLGCALAHNSNPPAGLDSRRMTEAAGASSSGRGGRRTIAWLGAAVLVSLAAGCPAQAKQHEAADGYQFERKEWVQKHLDVRIVEHSSFRELLEAMPNGGPPRAVRKVQAWSNIAPDGFCEIHIIDQTVSYTPEAIGHELAHCIYGRWHP